MSYDPEEIIRSYAENAEIEDQAEKYLSLCTEIPFALNAGHLWCYFYQCVPRRTVSPHPAPE